MHVALFNDTGFYPHVGCRAVGDALDRELRRAGMVVRYRHVVHEMREWWEGDRARFLSRLESSLAGEHVRQADAVIVNAEGSIHDGYGLHLLGVLEYAQREGVACALVNASLGGFEGFVDVIRGLDHVVAREERTASRLREAGVQHRVAPDAIAWASFEERASDDFAQRVVITDFDQSRAGSIGGRLAKLRAVLGDDAVDFPLEGVEHARRWRESVARLRGARCVVTARHHGVYLAMLAGVPFVALRANTDKIDGTLQMLAPWASVCEDDADLVRAIEHAQSQRERFAALARELHTRRESSPLLGGWRPRERSRRSRRASSVSVRGLASCVQSLAGLGAGPVLHVGCADGSLVRELLSLGADARGVDLVDAHGDALCGRLSRVDHPSDALPDADGVVCSDWLEHLRDDEVDAAISALVQAARSTLVVRVALPPRFGASMHDTARAREDWEARFLRHQLRRHPRAMLAVPYGAIEHEHDSCVLAFEKLPGSAPALRALDEHKQLHMDMLREAGRRGDAHVARYVLAAEVVRQGDVVLDAACGLGYGARVLEACSRCARIVGVDLEERAVAYATSQYASARAEFRRGDVQDLSFLPDASVDVVVSFETLEHLPDPRRALREFARVLTPGGRLIASVPNDWTDETGRDPNPHHLHVYTWEKLVRDVREGSCGMLLPERAHAQVAGGGMKLRDAARTLRAASIDVQGNLTRSHEAEWWLITAMRDPVGAGKQGYRETVFPSAGEGVNAVAFARDYDNPWLARATVHLGQRASMPLLESLASRVFESARPGSADRGAALCVMVYRAMESGAARERADELRASVRLFAERCDGSPHALRWVCSNWYALGVLLLRAGERDRAREALERCCAVDVLRFSPLLATKTVDARYQLGLLAVSSGDLVAARAHWKHGLDEARRAVRGEWREVVGEADVPLAFGLPELSQVLDNAARCAWALGMGECWRHEPGLAWSASSINAAMSRQMLAEEHARLRDAWVSREEALAGVLRERDHARRRVLELLKELEHVRRADADAKHDAERLQREKNALWEDNRRLSEAWEQQRVVLQENEQERIRLFNEAQRLAKLWEELRAENARLSDAYTRQAEVLQKTAHERDENWKESQRLAREWDELRQRIATMEREDTRVRGELEQTWDRLRAQREDAEQLRARLAALEDALSRSQRSLASLRDELHRYARGKRYRALRVLRVIRELPQGHDQPPRS